MDRAILATWYDLPEGKEAAHLDWLHSTHLPALAALPGHAWVAHYKAVKGSAEFQKMAANDVGHINDPAIPNGTQYLLIIGAASPWLFVHPTAQWQADRRPAAEQARLAERTGTRTTLFIEEERVNGSEIEHRAMGGTPAPAIQFGCYYMDSVDSDLDIIEWYARDRGPGFSAGVGAISMRKLIVAAGHGKHGVFYEFTSIEARHAFEAQEFREHAKPRGGSALKRTRHLPGSATIGVRTWPPVG